MTESAAAAGRVESEPGNGWLIHHGNVLEVLRAQPDASFDALLCDPPYGFRFMNKRWDYGKTTVGMLVRRETWRHVP